MPSLLALRCLVLQTALEYGAEGNTKSSIQPSKSASLMLIGNAVAAEVAVLVTMVLVSKIIEGRRDVLRAR